MVVHQPCIPASCKSKLNQTIKERLHRGPWRPIPVEGGLDDREFAFDWAWDVKEKKRKKKDVNRAQHRIGSTSQHQPAPHQHQPVGGGVGGRVRRRTSQHQPAHTIGTGTKHGIHGVPSMYVWGGGARRGAGDVELRMRVKWSKSSPSQECRHFRDRAPATPW